MFKLCIFVGSCYILNSYKHYYCHLTAQCRLEQFNPLFHKCHNNACWMSDFLLKTHWYITLQCHYTAQCTPNYITLCSMNDKTTPSTFRVSTVRMSHMFIVRVSYISLSAVFHFCCCLVVQKLGISNWSEMYFMCANYFSLHITAQISGEWVGLIWLIFHAFILGLHLFWQGMGVCV